MELILYHRWPNYQDVSGSLGSCDLKSKSASSRYANYSKIRTRRAVWRCGAMHQCCNSKVVRMHCEPLIKNQSSLIKNNRRVPRSSSSNSSEVRIELWTWNTQKVGFGSGAGIITLPVTSWQSIPPFWQKNDPSITVFISRKTVLESRKISRYPNTCLKNITRPNTWLILYRNIKNITRQLERINWNVQVRFQIVDYWATQLERWRDARWKESRQLLGGSIFDAIALSSAFTTLASQSRMYMYRSLPKCSNACTYSQRTARIVQKKSVLRNMDDRSMQWFKMCAAEKVLYVFSDETLPWNQHSTLKMSNPWIAFPSNLVGTLQKRLWESYYKSAQSVLDLWN